MNYESMFLVNQDLSVEEADNINKKVLDYIQKSGGDIVSTENLGKQQLAYPIQKRESAYYYLNYFKMDVENLDGLEKLYRYDENVIRFLTTTNSAK